jgi:putative ABC transport system permease protein
MSRPPRLATAILSALLPRAFSEFVLGDMEEEYQRRAVRETARHAARWYWRQSLTTLAASFSARGGGERTETRSTGRLSAMHEGPGTHGESSMKNLLQDMKYGMRMIGRQPGFAAVVIVTLALAIGANTVIFSFTNILLLRPLPINDQDTIGWIYNIDPQRGSNRARLSLADFLDYRDSLKSFTTLAGSAPATLTLSGEGDAVRLTANRVTVSLFEMWGLSTRAGRLFRPGEDAPGAAPVVLLAHQFWQKRFGGDPSVVGRAVTLNGKPATVVGVLAPDIEIGNLSVIDAYVPLVLTRDGSRRDERVVQVSGRLAPGVTHEQATAEVHAVAARLQRDYPTTNTGWDARVATTRESMAGENTWVVLALLVLVVAFVLLIACANLANLVLARSIDRRKEIAVRTALGAGRLRLVRQLITENLILGVLGGTAGLILAYVGIRIIKAIAFEPFFALLSIDQNVLTFVTVVSLLTPILFGLLPALHVSRTHLVDALKEGSARAIGGVHVNRGRATLVVAQVALALSLVVVAGLIVRTLIAQNRIDVGFETKDLLTFRLDVPGWRYADDAARRQLFDRMLPRLSKLPGVRGAAAVSRLPVIGGEPTTPVTIQGRPVPKPSDQPWAVRLSASEDFFKTAGIALLAGRGFTALDSADAPRVAVVSLEMARRYWKTPAAAVGQQITLGDRESVPEWRTVVGVVGGTKPPDVTLPPNPQLYVPLQQDARGEVAFMIRAAGADSLAAPVRAAMREIDPALALYELRTMESAFEEELSSAYVLAGLYVAFAAIAVLLAAAGLYGVISYSISQRTQEIGIRLALGAVPRDVRQMVFRQAAKLMIVGAVLGLLAAAAISQTMRTLLYGVSPLDPVTYSSVLGILAVVMLAATYLPIRRAMKIDPMRALRAD